MTTSRPHRVELAGHARPIEGDHEDARTFTGQADEHVSEGRVERQSAVAGSGRRAGLGSDGHDPDEAEQHVHRSLGAQHDEVAGDGLHDTSMAAAPDGVHDHRPLAFTKIEQHASERALLLLLLAQPSLPDVGRGGCVDPLLRQPAGEPVDQIARTVIEGRAKAVVRSGVLIGWVHDPLSVRCATSVVVGWASPVGCAPLPRRTAVWQAPRSRSTFPATTSWCACSAQRDELLRLVEAAFPATDDPRAGQRDHRRGRRAPSGSAACSRSWCCCSSRARASSRRRSRRTIDMVKADERPSEVLTAEVLRSRRGRTVRPKTSGQKRYVDAIREQRHHLRHRPGGHRQVLAGGGHGGAGAPGEGGRPHHPHPARRSRRASGSASCPATSWPRSTRTCGRSTTPSTTWSTPRAPQRLLERGTVEVAPLAFMRGRTLNASFIILDEAQNTTPEQMKMFLTRIGFGSKAVVTGDITQVDVPGGRSGPRRPRARSSAASTGSRSCTSTAATSCATASCRTSSTPTSAAGDGRERAGAAERRIDDRALGSDPFPSRPRRRPARRGRRRSRSSSPTSSPTEPRRRRRGGPRLAEQVLRGRGVSRARPSCRCSSSTRTACRPEPAVHGHRGPDRRAVVPDRRRLVEPVATPTPRPPGRTARRTPTTLPLLLGDVVDLPGGGRPQRADPRRDATTTSWPCSSCTASCTSSGMDHADRRGARRCRRTRTRAARRFHQPPPRARDRACASRVRRDARRARDGRR